MTKCHNGVGSLATQSKRIRSRCPPIGYKSKLCPTGVRFANAAKVLWMLVSWFCSTVPELPAPKFFVAEIAATKVVFAKVVTFEPKTAAPDRVLVAVPFAHFMPAVNLFDKWLFVVIAAPS